MPISRKALWIFSATLLLTLGVGSLLLSRSRVGTRFAEEPFHASDLAQIGHTGLPQLVEFYHPG